MPMFTPEELAAVGYTDTADTSSNPAQSSQGPFTPEELASVGYMHPTAQEQVPIPNQESNSALQEARDASRAIIGEIGSLGAGTIENVGKLVGSQGLQDFGAERRAMGDQMVSGARESSPIAGGIGKYGTDIAGILATTPSSIAGMAAGGALAGLSTSAETNPVRDILEGAVLGAAIGTGAKAVGAAFKSKTVGNIIAGAKTRWQTFTDKESFIDSVTEAALKAKGGDASKVTPIDLLRKIDAGMGELKGLKGDFYTARNLEAEARGIRVDRSGLSEAIQKLKAQTTDSSSSAINAAIKEGEMILSVGKPVSFGVAESGISELTSAARTAERAGNPKLQAHLLGLATALGNDIEKAAVGNKNVLDLHAVAKGFFRDVYKPIADLNVEKVIAEKVTDRAYLQSFVNRSILNSPRTAAALKTADIGYKDAIVAANINALKEAATTAGSEGSKINLETFSRALDTQLKKFGEAYGTASKDMITLSDVLRGAVEAGKGENFSSIFKLTSVVAGIGGVLVGGIPGAAATVIAAKTPFLYSAGKLLNNKSAQELLKSARQLQQYPNSTLYQEVSDRIGKNFMSQFKDIPMRLAPAFGVSPLQDSDAS
jgi:hypothetical protein